MNFAVVDKNSNKVVAIINKDFKAYFEVYFPIFDLVEIDSVGSTTFSTEEGSISTISVRPIGGHLSSDDYHMISRIPEGVSIKEAYESIKRK